MQMRINYRICTTQRIAKACNCTCVYICSQFNMTMRDPVQWKVCRKDCPRCTVCHTYSVGVDVQNVQDLAAVLIKKPFLVGFKILCNKFMCQHAKRTHVKHNTYFKQHFDQCEDKRFVVSSHRPKFNPFMTLLCGMVLGVLVQDPRCSRNT